MPLPFTLVGFRSNSSHRGHRRLNPIGFHLCTRIHPLCLYLTGPTTPPIAQYCLPSVYFFPITRTHTHTHTQRQTQSGKSTLKTSGREVQGKIITRRARLLPLYAAHLPLICCSSIDFIIWTCIGDKRKDFWKRNFIGMPLAIKNETVKAITVEYVSYLVNGMSRSHRKSK